MTIRIAEFRERAGLTQHQLAKLVNVHPKTEWNWEQGYSSPNAAQLWDLCEALNTDPNTLVLLHIIGIMQNLHYVISILA